MPLCAVPGCTNSGEHLFPKEPTLKKKWEKAIRRQNFVATQHSRLCRNHFQESDYVGESAYTECYGGSVSDRQIIERSKLENMCDSGDSIMADRGFNVQDIFAPKDISINIPMFLKGRTQIPGIRLSKIEN